ncbi:hypothetical protein [Jeotgalibacillus campisalis]|uniref:Uncharacterized protein n=1 Tax=Jeotgalibacillus campisalis TaxID=220754 RepID=A0A0C2VQ75_9BACL|nr:hypothetical protein [Jeotgalibacillus campisalis]KIL51047.1 hypothetical protein KR50_09280 [Jeotgalibacillus campisalis]
MEKIVYFSDQFFSAGRKDIWNESKEKIGVLDLKSAFTSGVNVENAEGELMVEGGFPFLSGKWLVKQRDGTELGEVKGNFSWFSKSYRYTADRGHFEIESPAFSREYRMVDENGEEAATFKKVNGFFQAPAYELVNKSTILLTDELIAVVMGVNAIEKRRKAAASSGGG